MFESLNLQCKFAKQYLRRRVDSNEVNAAAKAVRTGEGRRAAELIGATYHCLDERDIFVIFDKPTIQKTIDLFRRVAPSLHRPHRTRCSRTSARTASARPWR